MILSSVQFGWGVFLFFSGTLLLSAQTTGSPAITLDLPEVTLLDVEPSMTVISFNFSPPTEAGKSLGISDVNATKWLNYSSAIKTSTPKRKVSVQINTLFPGLSVKVQAAEASTSGGGEKGTPTGKMTVTTTSIDIISGIGGAFTGTGINNGHQLTISLEIDDYKKLVQTSAETITITYTISN